VNGDLFIGIDPGGSGGLAALHETGVVEAVDAMPATEAEICDWFARLRERAYSLRYAVIERVWSSPQMGVRSAFTFGRSYGGLLMALAARQVPHSEVTPKKWQAEMGCLSGGDKNVTKRRAQQLFPSLGRGITHATADALLIAEYARREFLSTQGVRP
jgi:Holliday junction resolvasome RuvABC endonuclease subunit